MDNFYIRLKQNIDSIDYLKENIENFNDLSDNDIKSLFADDEISFDFKEIIAEFCYSRINLLPFNILMNVLFYVENPKIFISNYGDRINGLSYDELTDLIYEGNLNNECLIEITKIPCFKRYLFQEKDLKISSKLQVFAVSFEIYLNNNNIDELNHIGDKINNLLQISSNCFEDIEKLVNNFLDVVVNNYEDITLESDINTICISMMNYYIKNHKQLSDKLIKFYILFRLKELSLQSCCKHVNITEQTSLCFGYYQESSQTLKIFSNYLKNKFNPFFKEYNITDENEINDFLNLLELFMISHELGHIVRHAEYNKFINSVYPEQLYEKLKENTELYYWYKNGVLRLATDEVIYNRFHDYFIEENRADLFAIFDSNVQINRYFKNSFSKVQLQRNCKLQAGNIIKMYTERVMDEQKIVTPMQKFDKFFKSILPTEQMLSISQKLEITDNANEIINNLLLGDYVPEYILEKISKVANGEIITDDMHMTILETIKRIEDYGEDKKIK